MLSVKYRIMKIPKIIHQLWDEKIPLPEFFSNLGETWKNCNPSWKYIFWDKSKMDYFVQESFPSFMSTINGFKHDVQRWDVIRYLILYKYGGVYVDFDYECLESLDNLLRDKSCCFGLEPREHAQLFKKEKVISNAFIAITPRHQFMEQILKTVQHSSSIANEKLIYVLETTGPHMLVDLYDQYPKKEEISLIPSEFICPLTKMDVSNYINGLIDEELLGEKIKNAVAIHYFWGSWG